MLAAEAIRTLDHLALVAPVCGQPEWEEVGDLYRVVGELGVLVERLPQVCAQVARDLRPPGGGGGCY